MAAAATVPGRLRRTALDHLPLLGVVGAMLLLLGGSWYQALIAPPYRWIDEQAHAGYVLALQEGRLPTIDTPIDQADGGEALRERLAYREPDRRKDVWVANNPPLPYVLALPGSALTRALGLPGGPLLGLRLLNVVATAAAVGVTYLLGRDLAGGDRRVGVLAAALTAATPSVGYVASLGFVDGVSLLATTGTLWALARVCGAGPPDADRAAAIRWLGLWAAFAAATRPMALMLAVAAGALAFAVAWWRHLARPVWTALWLGAPTAVLAGWFYLLNVHRYGDITGSAKLLAKHGRTPVGTLWQSLTTLQIWSDDFRTITTQRLQVRLPDDPVTWYWIALAVVGLGVVGTAALVGRDAWRAHRVVGAGDDDEPPAQGAARPLPGIAWAAVALTSLTPIVLVAEHHSQGGMAHARYLLPMVPPVAVAVALAVVRLATRWAGLVLLGAVTLAALLQTRASARWLAANRKGPPGSHLVTAYGTEAIRGAGFVVAGAGLVLVVAAVALLARPQALPDDEPAGTGR